MRPELQTKKKRKPHSRRAESVRIMKCLRKDAGRIAAHFGLKYKEITAQRNDVTGHFGVCYEDGSIQIRLRHATTGKLLRYSSLIHTLVHELAHLRYFDHGIPFQRLNRQMLAWARDQGIYEPKPRLKAAKIAEKANSSKSRAKKPKDSYQEPSDTDDRIAIQLWLFDE